MTGGPSASEETSPHEVGGSVDERLQLKMLLIGQVKCAESRAEGETVNLRRPTHDQDASSGGNLLENLELVIFRLATLSCPVRFLCLRTQIRWNQGLLSIENISCCLPSSNEDEERFSSPAKRTSSTAWSLPSAASPSQTTTHPALA